MSSTTLVRELTDPDSADMLEANMSTAVRSGELPPVQRDERTEGEVTRSASPFNSQ